MLADFRHFFKPTNLHHFPCQASHFSLMNLPMFASDWQNNNKK
jgi:hypothetical protein